MGDRADRADLAEFKQVRSADVWKGERPAATLLRTDVGVEFAYTDDYLSNPGPPVATTLPVTDIAVHTSAGAVPAFFAGLLPEGRRLSSLRRAVKTSADDDLTLLLAVGSDPVGDVRVLPRGSSPSVTRALVEVQKDWSEVRFRDMLTDAGVHDLVALAGVQDKASARVLSVPVANSGRRYILKIDPPEFPNVVLDEHYFLSLARKARFPVVNARVVHDCDGRAGLLVERFDRVLDSSTMSVRSLPVEDATQVMNLYPKDKYSVTTEAMSSAFASVCASSLVALREVYRQVLFAWLTGNGDLHAKNISVLGGARVEWRIAPAYDLPSTLPYRDRTLALSVGGRTDNLSRKALLEFARAIGLPGKAAEDVLDETLVATGHIFEDWGTRAVSPFARATTADTLRVLRNRHRLASA